jgi:head-tail adaptor
MRFHDTVTVVRAPEVAGPDGAVSNDWTTPESEWTLTDYPGELQPISSTEDIVGQERTESTHKAFLPADADITATDRIRFLGTDYWVDGQPERHRRGGRNHHVEAFCFRVTGG